MVSFVSNFPIMEATCAPPRHGNGFAVTRPKTTTSAIGIRRRGTAMPSSPNVWWAFMATCANFCPTYVTLWSNGIARQLRPLRALLPQMLLHPHPTINQQCCGIIFSLPCLRPTTSCPTVVQILSTNGREIHRPSTPTGGFFTKTCRHLPSRPEATIYKDWSHVHVSWTPSHGRITVFAQMRLLWYSQSIVILWPKRPDSHSRARQEMFHLYV